jgi:hypothetical protein
MNAGEEERMKESCREDVANHSDPESWAATGNGKAKR